MQARFGGHWQWAHWTSLLPTILRGCVDKGKTWLVPELYLWIWTIQDIPIWFGVGEGFKTPRVSHCIPFIFFFPYITCTFQFCTLNHLLYFSSNTHINLFIWQWFPFLIKIFSCSLSVGTQPLQLQIDNPIQFVATMLEETDPDYIPITNLVLDDLAFLQNPDRRSTKVRHKMSHFINILFYCTITNSLG